MPAAWNLCSFAAHTGDSAARLQYCRIAQLAALSYCKTARQSRPCVPGLKVITVTTIVIIIYDIIVC